MREILNVKDLRTYFYMGKDIVKAVDGISYSMYEGKTLGVVGESGCGKSVNAMSILDLIDGTGEVVEGSSIKYNGKELVGVSDKEMRYYRGNEISIIFQEPMTSLNPIFKVGNQITESIMAHKNVDRKKAMQRAIELLKLIGIPRAENVVRNYPHELSGGMRQRVMIAMALVCDPKILIADEPTTALDVTIQAQILSLMDEMQKETNTSIMLITHDLGVVAQMAHYVLVMYSGKVVESAPVEELFANPKHPYTMGLLNSIPSIHEDRYRLHTIDGVVPSPFQLPKGCYFSPRCEYVMGQCLEDYPGSYVINEKHTTSCYMYRK